jgi:hypothetical protein
VQTLWPLHTQAMITPLSTIETVEATRSSLSSWSWYDVARTLAGTVAGGIIAALLGMWLSPAIWHHPQYPVRAIRAACAFAIWAVPLTAGLCLSAGQVRRAWHSWLRRTIPASLMVGVATAACGAIAALDFSPALPPGPLAFQPVIGCPLLVTAICVGSALAFRQERYWKIDLIFGVIIGIGTGWMLFLFALYPSSAVRAWSTPGAHIMIMLCVAGILGFIYGVACEITKTEWLLVLFGDEQGRHWRLYEAHTLTLGTAENNTLRLDATGGVRPLHARISMELGDTTLTSENGAKTYLNGKPITHALLDDGDTIQIGETVFRYCAIHQRTSGGRNRRTGE